MIVVCCRSGIELWRHNRQDKSHQTIRERRAEKRGGGNFLIFLGNCREKTRGHVIGASRNTFKARGHDTRGNGEC
jgi:hypothetical protein